jgi:hypothetical protein
MPQSQFPVAIDFGLTWVLLPAIASFLVKLIKIISGVDAGDELCWNCLIQEPYPSGCGQQAGQRHLWS